MMQIIDNHFYAEKFGTLSEMYITYSRGVRLTLRAFDFKHVHMSKIARARENTHAHVIRHVP